MARTSCNDWRVLVRGVVNTLMVLVGGVPLHATLSMGGRGFLVSTGAFADLMLQDVALMSVLGGLSSSFNCLTFVIFVTFVIAREGFGLGIPTKTRANSASTHGDNGGIISPPLTSDIFEFSIMDSL